MVRNFREHELKWFEQIAGEHISKNRCLQSTSRRITGFFKIAKTPG